MKNALNMRIHDEVTTVKTLETINNGLFDKENNLTDKGILLKSLFFKLFKLNETDQFNIMMHKTTSGYITKNENDVFKSSDFFNIKTISLWCDIVSNCYAAFNPDFTKTLCFCADIENNTYCIYIGSTSEFEPLKTKRKVEHKKAVIKCDGSIGEKKFYTYEFDDVNIENYDNIIELYNIALNEYNKFLEKKSKKKA